MTSPSYQPNKYLPGNVAGVAGWRQSWHRFWWQHQRQVWQVLIVAGLLLFTAGAILFLPSDLHLFVAAAPVGVAVFLAILRWPALGLVLFLPATMVRYIEVPLVGPAAALIIVLFVLWLFRQIAGRQRFVILDSGTIPPLVVFSAVVLVSFGIGFFPWYPVAPAPIDAQIAGVFIFILSFIMFLLAAHQIRDIRWLQALVVVYLLFGAFYIVNRTIPGFWRYNQMIFSTRSLGSVFWVWLLALSFSQAVFNTKMDKRLRLLALAVAGCTVYVGLFRARGWVSGWVPPLTALIVILLVARPKLALPMVAVGILGGVIFSQQILDMVMIGDNEYSTLTRLEAWRIMAQIVSVNPLLGLGPANYYFYTPQFSILGWYVQFNSHNNYVDIIAQSGLLGMFCFVWFVLAYLRESFRLLPKVPKGGFMQAYTYGAIGGLAGMVVAGMLGDWVLPFVYNIGIEGMRAAAPGWLFLGGLVAIMRIVDQKQTAVD